MKLLTSRHANAIAALHAARLAAESTFAVVEMRQVEADRAEQDVKNLAIKEANHESPGVK